VALDEELAGRLRDLLADQPDVTEKRMFGGHAFLVGGRLAVSASSRGGLLVRVDPARSGPLAQEPGVGPFVMRGREMDGWLHVEVAPNCPEEDLARWVREGVSYARSLPVG
jgi:hypothetical protein